MTLSERKERALELSRQGYSHSGIAEEIGVTEQTAKKYLNTIEDEIGVEALIDY